MAIDPANLTQSELLQVVNHTPLGVVLTRSRLRRQMDAGALRFGDGSHIHLVRYARWLAHELARPRSRPMDYAEARRRQAQRNRAVTKAGQDIGPIPEVEDAGRRQATSQSFRLFCETYFAPAFSRRWSQDHLKVIASIERAVIEGGLFAFAMPRGSGKTTLARFSALWAVLAGYRPFVCLIGGSSERARDLLIPIKKCILENPFLLADFPEAVYPLRCLENSSKRQLQQHIAGRLTHVHWGQESLVLPTVEAEHLPIALRDEGLAVSPSSGSIITVTSLDANMRGQQHTRVDGSIIRPSLVLLDDPQTRQSAASATQTRRRMELLNGDVLGMAGPGRKIAAMLTCTKMYAGDLADQVLDRRKAPQWQGQCTKLVYSWPKAEKLWDEYRSLRNNGLREGRGVQGATEFYRKNREAMDAGAKVAWDQRYNEDEISALQHAVNLRLDMSEDAFAAEYQNEPVGEQQAENVLTVEQVAARFNGRKRCEAPLDCTHLTAFIDVHKKLLYYCVCGWQEDFTGFVIDYGTLPDQRRAYFTLGSSTRTLGRSFQGMGEDGAIQAGLEQLVTKLLQRDWPRRGGALLRIDRLLVDMGYKPRLVAAVQHKVGGAAMMLSKGVGIRAGNKPISMYQRRGGWTLGEGWYIPSVHGTAEFPHICLDVNYWKSFVHEHLAIAPGDPGALTVFGQSAGEHQLLAEHVANSETWTPTHGHGRTVHEWKTKSSRPDNHWLDCLVGCAAAASMAGLHGPGMPRRTAKRKTVSIAAAMLAKEARGGPYRHEYR